MSPVIEPETALRAVKVLHTAVWVVFAGAILAIPVFTITEQWVLVVILAGVVTAECLVLAANRMRCPLTDVAARYTTDRRDNFDIYLPEWLAKHNKLIFGTLFTADLCFAVVWWWA